MISVVIISLIVVFGSYYVFSGESNENEEEIKYSYAKVTNGDIFIDLMTDGQIEIPIKKYSFKISREIESINVDLYKEVKVGHILATLNTLEIENTLNEAELNLESAVLDKEKIVLIIIMHY